MASDTMVIIGSSDGWPPVFDAKPLPKLMIDDHN